MKTGLKNMKNKDFKEIIKFINFLDSLKDEEKKKIEKGELVIEFMLTPKTLVNNPNNFNGIDNFNEMEVINMLESMASNEEGTSYLERMDLRRAQLERILKKLDSPYDKKDNIARLISKIIEATIGFRLRSQAIQGATATE